MLNRWPLFLLLISALLGQAGCAAPLAPLGRYNDAWAGVLKVHGQELSIRVDLFITHNDQRDERKPPHSKPCFGEFYLDEVGPLSAQGQVSHYDFGELEKVSHAPQPQREFLELKLQHIGAIALDRSRPGAQQRYKEAHDRLLARLGQELGKSLGQVTLYGERHPGDQLRGIAVLNKSSTGACAHKDEDGRCTQWHVNASRARIGTFTLKRTGLPATCDHMDDNTVASRAFIYKRRSEGPGHLGWSVHLRPQAPLPPPVDAEVQSLRNQSTQREEMLDQ